MGRVCILVAIILMFSSLSLVTARYQARQLYDQLDRYRSNSRDLEIDWRRLQLDRAAESSNAKVDRLAREDLKMTGVTPERTVYVAQPRTSAGATTGAGPGAVAGTGSSGGVR
jgi:cell division protein FtsL